MKKSSVVSRVKKSKKSKPARKVLEKKLDELWSLAVREKEGNKCAMCGSKSSLSAHHVFGRRHTATRWEIDNGICLCYPHHIHWAHRDIGGFFTWWRNRVGDEMADVIEAQHRMIAKPTTDELMAQADVINSLIKKYVGKK
jgi:hypothetical protein